MTAEQQERMLEAQLRDVAEMHYIFEAAAQGKSASEACREVIGGHFELSPLVTSGIENAGSVMNLSTQVAESVDHLVKLHRFSNNDCVLQAGKDWLHGEIAALEIDLGLKIETEDIE